VSSSFFPPRGSAFSQAAPQASQVLERDWHQLLQRSHATNNLEIVYQITLALANCKVLWLKLSHYDHIYCRGYTQQGSLKSVFEGRSCAPAKKYREIEDASNQCPPQWRMFLLLFPFWLLCWLPLTFAKALWDLAALGDTLDGIVIITTFTYTQRPSLNNNPKILTDYLISLVMTTILTIGQRPILLPLT